MQTPVARAAQSWLDSKTPNLSGRLDKLYINGSGQSPNEMSTPSGSPRAPSCFVSIAHVCVCCGGRKLAVLFALLYLPILPDNFPASTSVTLLIHCDNTTIPAT
jgi:hypothetical protein